MSASQRSGRSASRASKPATAASDPKPEGTAAPALKEIFNAARYRQLADAVASLYPAFDRKRFLQLTLDGLEGRELLQRLRRASEALHETLPANYPDALRILDALAPRIGHTFASLVLPDFVGLYGREDVARSLDALKRYTVYGSSEFAIREFLKRELTPTLNVMQRWAEDENEHVRRLASEGSRPRLPWSFRLEPIVKDPTLTAPILLKLLRDPSLYVRKSVANHLNDISKDHPEWLVAWLGELDLTHPHSAWIAKRALRTLIKKGHPGALALIGVEGRAKVRIARFGASPRQVALGGAVTLELVLTSTARTAQRLVIDYAIHFVKSSGAANAKVFKWKECTLPAGGALELRKPQRIQTLTTRKHYAGKHKIDLLINGQRLGETSFMLQL